MDHGLVRRAAAALAALGLVGAAQAGWTPVRTTSRSIDYVDLQSVVALGDLRRVWTLADLVRPDQDGDRSYRTLLEVDCRNTIYRSLEGVFYDASMAGGRATGRTDAPSPWRQVSLDSTVGAVMGLVCTSR